LAQNGHRRRGGSSAFGGREAVDQFVGWVEHSETDLLIRGRKRWFAKVRWGRGGSGKRGGARVIYFYRDADLPLYLLMIYAKARQEDLSADEKRAVRKLVGILKS
jgi:hypothetical protein